MIRSLPLSLLLLMGLAAAETAPLEHRAFRTWDLELPDLQPVHVSGAIELGGRSYATAQEGTNLAVDTDGDGETDVTVAADTEAKVSLVTLRDAEGAAVYTLRLSQGAAGWQFTTTSGRKGKIAGTRVTVFDQNHNGRYDDIGADAITVGQNKAATFLGKTIHLGGELFSLSIDPAGTKVTATPYEGETGILDLRSELETKAKLLSAIVVSTDGMQSFDLARSREGLVVPTGGYRLFQGKLGLGQTSVSVLTGRTSPLVVTADEAKTLAWGGPAGAEFAYQRQGDQLVLDPARVWYYGRAGEQYAGWSPVGKSPVFTIADSTTGQVLASAIFPAST